MTVRGTRAAHPLDLSPGRPGGAALAAAVALAALASCSDRGPRSPREAPAQAAPGPSGPSPLGPGAESGNSLLSLDAVRGRQILGDLDMLAIRLPLGRARVQFLTAWAEIARRDGAPMVEGIRPHGRRR